MLKAERSHSESQSGAAQAVENAPAAGSTNVRILIADDHPLVRFGVKTTLQRATENEVVGEACNAEETLRYVRSLKPDMITLDLDMPGPCTPEDLAAQCLEVHPTLRILVLTAHDDEATVRRLKKIRLSGYLLKDEAPEHLLQAVRAIQQGAVWFSQSIAHKMMGLDLQEDAAPTLTPRERQVLAAIGKGVDNRTIANELSLAEQTVRNYATTIYEKIGVTSRVEAAVWARDRGIL